MKPTHQIRGVLSKQLERAEFGVLRFAEGSGRRPRALPLVQEGPLMEAGTAAQDAGECEPQSGKMKGIRGWNGRDCFPLVASSELIFLQI